MPSPLIRIPLGTPPYISMHGVLPTLYTGQFSIELTIAAEVGTQPECRNTRARALRNNTELMADCRHQVYVTVDWLKKNLQDVAVVDVRGVVTTDLVKPGVESSTYTACRDDYRQGHIQLMCL